MPRQSSFTTDQLAERALQQFWAHGYNATSMDALVQSTGVSRHAIYSNFGDKHGLFQACFARYQELVVTPAFSVVERPDADLESVADYFETQIAAAEALGLPGPGCFVANSATEVAPHDTYTLAQVTKHNDRLHAGFLNALANTSQSPTARGKLDDLSRFCVVFTNGLWTASRTTTDAEELRSSVHLLLQALQERLS